MTGLSRECQPAVAVVAYDPGGREQGSTPQHTAHSLSRDGDTHAARCARRLGLHGNAFPPPQAHMSTTAGLSSRLVARGQRLKLALRTGCQRLQPLATYLRYLRSR